MVTSGPGLTNLITPMLDAQNDSCAMVVISGNVPLKFMGTQAFQECPSLGITKPFTKWSKLVECVDDLPYILDKAFYIAQNGKKGCVHIDLPKCVSADILKQVNIKLFNKNNFKSKKFFPNTNLLEISNLINKAEKPILILGQGCKNDSRLIRQFVKLANIPVTSTLHGVGIYPETCDLSLKFLGMHGNAAANIAVQNADLIVNIGSRFDDRTTGNINNYAPEAKKAFKKGKGGIIHINIDESEIHKNIKSHFNLVTDSEKFLTNIMALIKYNKRESWLNKINELKTQHKFKFVNPKNNLLNTQMVINEINKNLPKKHWIITTGVGNHQMWTSQFIDWINPKTFITSGSLGVMGSAIGYSIGSQIANPNSLIIQIDGDGSFNQTLSELRTINKYNYPIKIAIMNDSQMSMVKTWEKLFFDERYVATDLNENPDYVKLAESFGIKGISCENVHNLKKTIKYFLNYDGPIVCNFKTQSEMCFPLVAPGAALDDMILDSNQNIIVNKSEVPS